MPTLRPFAIVLALAALAPCRAQQPTDAAAKAPALERLLAEAVATIEGAQIPSEALPALERLVQALGERAEATVAARILELCKTAGEWQALDAATVEDLIEQTVAAQQSGQTELVAASIVALTRFAPQRHETHSLRFELFGRATPLFDAAKAFHSLGELRGMMPSNQDGWGEVARKVLGLAFIVGDIADGIDAVRTLLSYWNGCESLLKAGQPIRAPTPSDVRVFRLLPVIHGDYMVGQRAAVVASLDAWAKEQPDNVAQLLLFALAQSSLTGGEVKDRYAPEKARALLDRILALTDPKAKPTAPETAWTFHEVRGVLLQFDVPCGDSIEALRRYVTDLGKTVKDQKSLPLAHFADYAPLARQVKSRSEKLAKRQEDLATLDGLVKSAEREIRAAGGRPGKTPGTFDMGSSDQREKLASLVMKYNGRRDKYNTLAKTLETEEALLMAYRSRLADYDHARSR